MGWGGCGCVGGVGWGGCGCVGGVGWGGCGCVGGVGWVWVCRWGGYGCGCVRYAPKKNSRARSVSHLTV